MKNWAVALSTAVVRAIASVPRSFESPFVASFRIGARVSFLSQVGRHAAALDHEAAE